MFPVWRLFFCRRMATNSTTNWRYNIAQAEKLVDYSSSYLSLQSLLSGEEASLAMSVRRLIGTKHPLIATAKQIFYNDDNSIQTYGLIVLLMSQAANDLKQAQKTKNAILTSQRNLSEIVEIVYTANLLHSGVLDVSEMNLLMTNQIDKLKLGNKLAVLGGDFLLANASVALAKLEVPEITASIAQAIADMSESGIMYSSMDQQQQIPTKENWERWTFLRTGSLLAHSCRSTVLLAGIDDKSVLDGAFAIGRDINFAYMLNREMNNVSSTNSTTIGYNSEMPVNALLQNYGQLASSQLATLYSNNTNLDAFRTLTQLVSTIADGKLLR